MSEKPPPFFSVVIPVFNKGPQIQRSVSSALNQTFEDFELIIVNDASRDNSLEEIMKFNDPRIRVLHRDTPGPGGYAARNLAVRAAQSDWIAFLDADDFWYSHHLKSSSEMISRFPGRSFMVFAYDSCVENNCSPKGVSEEEDLSRYDAVTAIARADLIHTNGVLVRRSVFCAAGGFPENGARRGGDSDLWLRLIWSSNGVVFSPERTSRYQRDLSGVMTNPINLVGGHPIEKTISQYLLTQRLVRSEATALKRLSNRKVISWALLAKDSGLSWIAHIRTVHYTALIGRDIYNIVRLLVPKVCLSLLMELARLKKKFRG